MPRASLSPSLLSTQTNVQKKYLYMSIGKRGAFISPTQFRNKTGTGVCEN